MSNPNNTQRELYDCVGDLQRTTGFILHSKYEGKEEEELPTTIGKVVLLQTLFISFYMY